MSKKSHNFAVAKNKKYHPLGTPSRWAKRQFIMAKIYTGEEARVTVNSIIENVAKDVTYPLHGGAVGYFQDEGGKWVAWDNSTFDCRVEEFDTEQQAERYALEGIIDTY